MLATNDELTGELIAVFRVVRPGQAKIVIMVKPHFREPWRVEREIPLEGVPG